MKIYYAHSMHLYGRPQEKRDIVTLESLGFEVLNPNSPEISEGCKQYREAHGKDKVMEYFVPIINSCNALAFRSHIDGKIPAGVAYEINVARQLNLPIIELPNLVESRMMEVGETVQYLQLLGER